MKDMIEIEVILDERYADPLVTIRTKSNTQQVEIHDRFQRTAPVVLGAVRLKKQIPYRLLLYLIV